MKLRVFSLRTFIVVGVFFIMIGALIIGNRKYNLEPWNPWYTGEWIVHSRYDKKPYMKAQYYKGVKHGKEISWYQYPDTINTEQVYRNGVLHGISRRYDSIPGSAPSLEGIFRDGHPWEGTFLTNARNEIITSAYIDFGMRDVVWGGARYKDGVEIEQGYIGPKGLEIRSLADEIEKEMRN